MGQGTGIRVMIVDDHSLFAQGVARLLQAEPGISVAGVATSAAEGLALARQLRPDVVLMDINMRGLDGIEATRRLRQMLPGTKVMLLTVLDDDKYIVRGIRAGAMAYVLKDSTPEELVRTLRLVHAGGSVITPGVAREILDLFDGVADAVANEGVEVEAEEAALTCREKQILAGISSGRSTKEIAFELGIADKTVRNHVSKIYRKLHLFDRVQLVLHAVRQGLVKP